MATEAKTTSEEAKALAQSAVDTANSADALSKENSSRITQLDVKIDAEEARATAKENEIEGKLAEIVAIDVSEVQTIWESEVA